METQGPVPIKRVMMLGRARKKCVEIGRKHLIQMPDSPGAVLTDVTPSRIST